VFRPGHRAGAFCVCAGGVGTPGSSVGLTPGNSLLWGVKQLGAGRNFRGNSPRGTSTRFCRICAAKLPVSA